MSKWPACWRIILILVLTGAWSGCVPTGDSQVDEEKEPNFIEGRNHQNAMDYKAAIASFERTVQANPRNAAAHFELGLLYQNRMNDPVSAIYHFQKHLEFRPKSEYAETARQQITGCKMELAKTVSFNVVSAEVHRDLQRLTNEVTLLKQQNDTLRAQLAAKPMVVTQWQTLRVTNTISVPQVVAPAPTQRVVIPPVTNNLRRVEQPKVTPLQAQAPQQRTQPHAPQTRSYQVRSGETMAHIARRYGITLEKLRAANPSVQPNRIRAGQVLIIPAE